MMHRIKGYSFIELIVFITVIALASALFIPIYTGLRGVQNLPNQTKAQQLAQARMELIEEQRVIVGFTLFSDPCLGGSPPAMCTVPTGFTVTSSIANNWNADTNYRVITVTVSGLAAAQLVALAANYD